MHEKPSVVLGLRADSCSRVVQFEEGNSDYQYQETIFLQLVSMSHKLCLSSVTTI